MAAVWAEDTKAFVREIYAAPDAGSFRDMAALVNARFNTAYTRAAVLGIVKRMGLKGKEPASPIKKGLAPARQRLRIIQSNHNGGMPRVVQVGEPAELPALRCVEIEPRNLTLLELERGECRYPYGDGPILFCGHAIRAGSSYCPAHHALCWQKPEIRRRPMGIAA